MRVLKPVLTLLLPAIVVACDAFQRPPSSPFLTYSFHPLLSAGGNIPSRQQGAKTAKVAPGSMVMSPSQLMRYGNNMASLGYLVGVLSCLEVVGQRFPADYTDKMLIGKYCHKGKVLDFEVNYFRMMKKVVRHMTVRIMLDLYDAQKEEARRTTEAFRDLPKLPKTPLLQQLPLDSGK